MYLAGRMRPAGRRLPTTGVKHPGQISMNNCLLAEIRVIPSIGLTGPCITQGSFYISLCSIKVNSLGFNSHE